MGPETGSTMGSHIDSRINSHTNSHTNSHMMDAWRGQFDGYGWTSYPLAFPVHEDLVTDDPATAALDATATRSLSLGVPHPQYGVMRATAIVTGASTLTQLATIVHGVSGFQFATARGLPHLYVGATPFVDRVDGRLCVVLGLLVFVTPAGLVEYAPLTLARWRDLWLPYFEDSKGWVVTGWDDAGRCAEIHKPFGWGCSLLVSPEHAATIPGTRASRCGADDTAQSATSSC